MNDCCVPKKASAQNCPSCNNISKSVSYKTVIHHVNYPANLNIDEAEFHFCDSKDCDTVYFNDKNMCFKLNDIRGKVGQKSASKDRPICYCFGIKASDIVLELNDHSVSTSRQRVLEFTKERLCDCVIKNPSGSCCLVDFREIQKTFKAI